MSWRDRLRTLDYTSPSGETFTLLFDDLSREVDKKAPVTEFPGQNRGAVQDLGQSTIRYPMDVYISGADYDVESDRFWAALNESGPAEMQHPRYGDLVVLPVTVSQSERFVEGAGQARFSVEFVEADAQQFEYPRVARTSPDAIAANAAAAAAQAADVAGRADIDDLGAAAALKENILNGLNTVTDAFDTITGFTDDLRNEINAQVSEITSTIDDLVQAPADLAESLLQLYRTPARVVTTIESKINGYQQIFNGLVDGFVNTTVQYGEMIGLIQQANAAGVQAAAAESTADGLIDTRAGAARISDALSDIQSGIDNAFDQMSAAVDIDYDLQAAGRRAVTSALRSLQERALNLPIEQSETLEQDEALIPLVDRLYGDVDAFDGTLDAFIAFNELHGSEILIVPQGKTVRWYE